MTDLRTLRLVGLLEGLSFVILLFVAMPLKYAYGQPLAVRIVGITHGVLFMILVWKILEVGATREWTLGRRAAGIAAALLPFGPFVFDRSLRREINGERDA